MLARLNDNLTIEELTRLGQIGEAYGGISALLSGLAVIGLVAALFVQIRQVRTSQVHSVRTMQLELMRMLLADPSLRPTSSYGLDIPPDLRRRNIFTNLMLQYLAMGYEFGYFPEAAIRQEMSRQFNTEDARRFWREHRATFEVDIVNRSRKRFFDVVDSAYREASSQVTSQAAKSSGGATRVRGPAMRRIRDIAWGVACGAAATGALVRLRNRR